MAKIDKVISIKVEGVRRIKELEDSLKKLRKEQRENKKQSEGDANRYSKTAKSIKDATSIVEPPASGINSLFVLPWKKEDFIKNFWFAITPLLVIGHRHTLEQHKVMGETDEKILQTIGYTNYIIIKGENNVK